MKKIKLTQGKYALVDNDSFEWLNQWKWHYANVGYAARCIGIYKKNRCYIYMHTLLNETPKGFETDHINRNKLDNRRKNLRIVTGSENSINKSLRCDNKSKYKGIMWDSKRNKWKVFIGIKKRHITLGRYSTIQGAWLARRLGERLYYGKPI